MCGIAGIYHFERKRPIDNSRLKKMTDVIYHRGPDGEGFFVDNNIGLGHRRLSIIDLDTGDQPMYSRDGNIIIVFNGEIYNYIEIREELISLGYSFVSNSDTEVVINSYLEWGYECQNKFNGMWAFALWDKNKQKLFISRDRIGEKPLHYALWDNSFIFGSEMKSIFEYGLPKEPLLEFIEVYLTLTNIPAPFTFYKHINKLMPGHFLIVKGSSYKEYKYWDLPEIDEKNMLKDKKKVYSQFEYLLSDSVKIRMRSDVPFGAFLSGGLDSSAIVSLMSENSSFPINTFTIGFPEKEFDESDLAEKVAKKFKTNHYRGTINPDNFNEILNSVAFHYDEPFGDSSAIPTGYVSRYASEEVKMVLTGDGGDEVLSGYPSYQGIKFANYYSKLPFILQKELPEIVNWTSNSFKGSVRYKMNRIESVFRTSSKPFNQRYIEKRAFLDYSLIKKLTSGIKNIIPVEDIIIEIMRGCSYHDDFYKLMYMNFKHDLPNDYLVKVDRMSMANSLETRVPFLDYRLIEFMVGVNKNIKMNGWERKSILRNTIGKRLPTEIMNASKKGFSIPLREWFKDKETISLLDMNVVRQSLNSKLIDDIIKSNTDSASDNGVFIWSLLLLNKALS